MGGQVNGVCTGRDEIGPRALCNRSLIAGGHSEETREKLNKVKRRQWWRPVTPVTTQALLDDCLDVPVNADLRFMNVAAPAIRHPEGTGRQLCASRWFCPNPGFGRSPSAASGDRGLPRGDRLPSIGEYQLQHWLRANRAFLRGRDAHIYVRGQNHRYAWR